MNTAVLSRIGRLRSPRVEAHAYPAVYRSVETVAVEQAPASTPAPRAAPLSSSKRRLLGVIVLRTVLVAGSVAATVIAWLAASGSSSAAGPDLVLLLRGMAVIKGLLAVSAALLVWWRLGQPVAVRVAATYIACAWVLFISTALIWQLVFIPAAAILFHVGGFVALVLALREGRQMPRSELQAPNPSIERTFQRPLRALWPAAHVKR